MSRKAKIRRIVFALVTLLWMVLIFAFSAQVGEQSKQTSGGVITVICSLFLRGFDSLSEAEKLGYIEALSFIVRKCAHCSIYALLAVWASGFLSTFPLKRSRVFLFSLGFCIIYAASDEIHQLFVPGRSGEAVDVFIDGCGAAVGGGLFQLLGHLTEKRRKNHE